MLNQFVINGAVVYQICKFNSENSAVRLREMFP